MCSRVTAYVLASTPPPNYAYCCLFLRLRHMRRSRSVSEPRRRGLRLDVGYLFLFLSPWKASSTLGHLKPWHKYSFKPPLAFSFWHGDVESFSSPLSEKMITCCQRFAIEKGHQIEWGAVNEVAFLLQFPLPVQFSALHSRGGGRTTWRAVSTRCKCKARLEH